MTITAESLGLLVAQELARNPKGCEVSLKALESLGIGIGTPAYIDWLEYYGLRAADGPSGFVCFVAARRAA